MNNRTTKGAGTDVKCCHAGRNVQSVPNDFFSGNKSQSMNEFCSLLSPSQARYQYEVCGLCVESDIPFSLPQPAQRAIPDIRFSLKALGHSTATIYPDRRLVGQIKNGAGHPSIAVYEVDRGLVLDCHNTQRRVEFVMPRDGRWIDCYAQSETTVEDIELWLFGLVMSFILQSRGVFTLHAAAVNCRGIAVAFLGSNGYGKSTLAFFFAKKGHSLITDDVLPIVEENNRLFALPGSPSMNLWSQTLDHVGWPDHSSSKPGGAAGKHRYGIDKLGFSRNESAVPLENIYFLQPTIPDDAQPVRIDSVTAAQAMVDLLGYTRANSMIEISAQKNLLRMYSRLLSRASLRRLTYPRGFEHLDEIYRAILQDIDCAVKETAQTSN